MSEPSSSPHSGPSEPEKLLAVVVTIEAHADQVEPMIRALQNNASHSVHEPECRCWEWSQHLDDPRKFAIYELYTSEEAFAAHKASTHFAEWLEASAPCIAHKVAGRYWVGGH